MRFQHKLILIYAILLILFSALLGVLSWHFMTETYYQDTRNNLSMTAQQMAFQYDTMYNAMQQVTEDILSDQDTLAAIRALKTPELYTDWELTEYRSTINRKIKTDYLMSNFYRVIFFNEHGTVLYSTMDVVSNLIVLPKQREERPAVKTAEELHGKPVLTEIHQDPWNPNRSVSVFSMIRSIVGDSLGYLEVQQQAEVLERLFTPVDSNMDVIVLLPDFRVLYNTEPEKEVFLENDSKDAGDGIYTDQESSKMLARTTSENGAGILVSVDLQSLQVHTREIKMIVIFAAVGFFLLTFSLVFIVSSHLTKPIRDIRRQMEKTEASMLDHQLVVKSSNDEIKALGETYNNLLKRLTESVDREKKLSLLQLQTQFDTLQAQVNPHFLYNLLNIIAARGLEDDDEIICEICGNLASMLRYSTSTLTRYATVRQEVEYLKQYVFLMKTRYEELLEVEIDIPEELYGMRLPKITLQQIVENSIHHGYSQSDSVMKIRVLGGRDKDGWMIQVADNGEGIPREALDGIHGKMEAAVKKIYDQKESMDIAIGNMGIVNLFSRLCLLYGKNVSFDIENAQEGGTVVTIHIREGEDSCTEC